MKTAILFYSKHHGNTKKLLDAIKEANPQVDLIDVTTAGTVDLSGYPSCNSVTQMNESNRMNTSLSRDELIGQGYQPCGNCHP